ITIHRNCFERVGIFNPTLKLKEDTDLIFRMLTAGLEYTLISKVLIKIHIHEHISLSRSISRIDKIDNMERFLAVHNNFLNKNLALWLLLYTSLAGDYYHNGQKKHARKLVFRICKKKWFSPKIWELFLRFELLKPLKTYLLKCSA
ncbi:MAG: hypothetical protein REH83_02680, partial [Rickettsiella sp.]|nr:hypothetical protein [Rickettsiella sp.]